MNETKSTTRSGAVLGMNLLIVLLTAAGVTQMLLSHGDKALTAYGLANLRYFTVLSNVLEGVAALCLAIPYIGVVRGTRPGVSRRVFRLKYVAATAVSVTFLVVALFFGPLYGYLILYEGANLWFHLVIPLLAILEFIFLDRFDELSFRETLLPVLAPLIYGLLYCLNLLANGVGTGPDTNDFYGFLLWGLPVGLCIFAGILLLVWAAGVLLRLGNRAGRKRNTERTGENA